MKEPPVTVIVTAYNVDGVIVDALKSLCMQKYPIREVIVIDNCSTDKTVQLLDEFKKKNTNVPIRVILQRSNRGLSVSYNLGAEIAKTSYIVTMHGDGLLPTPNELQKLMNPVILSSKVVAVGPKLLHPIKLWRHYPFWQKCLFVSSVGKEIPSGNGKFDCFKRDKFIAIGGFDQTHFEHAIGAEDADIYFRLTKIGSVVNSNARVIHNHPIDVQYSMIDWIKRRRYLAISYGRYLQLHLLDSFSQSAVLLVRPIIALLSICIFFQPWLIVFFIVYSFIYMPRMFLEKSTLTNPRILALPFVLIFLIYYELVHMLYYFMFKRR